MNSSPAKRKHTSFNAVRVGDVTVGRSGGDDVHDINGRPGERHAIAAQPLAENLRLVSQLLEFVPVLKIKKKKKDLLQNVFLSAVATNIPAVRINVTRAKTTSFFCTA